MLKALNAEVVFFSKSHHTGIEIWIPKQAMIGSYTLNRTTLELKSTLLWGDLTVDFALNRTTLELKFENNKAVIPDLNSKSHHTGIEIVPSSTLQRLLTTLNRTTLELKSTCTSCSNTFPTPSKSHHTGIEM